MGTTYNQPAMQTAIQALYHHTTIDPTLEWQTALGQ